MDDASHDGAGFHRWSPHFFVPPTNNDSTIESRSLSLSIVGWLCYDCAINVENHVPVCVRESFQVTRPKIYARFRNGCRLDFHSEYNYEPSARPAPIIKPPLRYKCTFW